MLPLSRCGARRSTARASAVELAHKHSSILEHTHSQHCACTSAPQHFRHDTMRFVSGAALTLAIASVAGTTELAGGDAPHGADRGAADAGGDQPQCTKEQFRAVFGATPTYQLLSDDPAIPPALEGGFLVAEVAYDTPCPGGGSEFTSYFLDKDMGGQPLKVLVLSRGEPRCDDAVRQAQAQPWRGTIAAEVPDDVRAEFLLQPFSFIAFPPDGEYELMDVKVREPAHIDGNVAVKPALRAQE